MQHGDDTDLPIAIQSQLRKSGFNHTVGEWVIAPALRPYVYPREGVVDFFSRPSTLKRAQQTSEKEQQTFKTWNSKILPTLMRLYYPDDEADENITWGICLLLSII